MKRKLACLMLLILLLSPLTGATGEITQYTKCGTHGSAKRLRGTTVIVSVFASDTKTSWDFGRDRDTRRYTRSYQNTKTAAKWLQTQAKKYGSDVRFVCDWLEHHDLYYTHTFDINMVTYDGFYDGPFQAYMDYIDKQLPTDELMKRYGAENILYIFNFNTPVKNPVGSYALPAYGKKASNLCQYEFVVMYTGLFGGIATPGTYAHEILHLYGVPDLYQANKDWKLTDRFIRSFRKNHPRDIMAGAGSKKQDRVEYTFSSLVAYYAGLVRSSKDQQKWNLRKSEFELYGY